jgi:hypothetical protein
VKKDTVKKMLRITVALHDNSVAENEELKRQYIKLTSNKPAHPAKWTLKRQEGACQGT